MQKALQEYDRHYGLGADYTSPEAKIRFFAQKFPSLAFYTHAFFGPTLRLCISAKRGLCDGKMWSNCSVGIGRILEQVGVRIEIEGMQHFENLQEPCIFIGNHMSTLETFVLPGIIRPRRPVTFVVKDGLMKMPFFGDVLRARKAIAVGRRNPREDLKYVLDEGKKKLDEGVSMVIFPQSTRSVEFNLKKFNSIGVKLAKHSQKPIIPLALKTDAWAQGSLVKDFGGIQPQKTVHFSFGAPIYVQDQGKAEHALICDFIQEHLAKWA